MTTFPVAQLTIARDRRPAEAALDGALLKQTGLLATLITERETAAPVLDHAELMRLVKSQQSLLSAVRQHAPVRADLNDAGEVFRFARKAG